MKADRYNKGKPQYSLLDLESLEGCVKVLEYGCKKYSRNNWKKGLNVTEIADSLLRHLGALLRGELIDLESGLSHIGHVQCNALFLGNKNNTMDIDCVLSTTGDNQALADDLVRNALRATETYPVSMEEYDKFVMGYGLCPPSTDDYGSDN